MNAAQPPQTSRSPLDVLSDLVLALDLVFDNDWGHTAHMLRADPHPDFLAKDGTFLRPGVADEDNDWANRGALLASYREAVGLLRQSSKTPEPQPAPAPEAQDEAFAGTVEESPWVPDRGLKGIAVGEIEAAIAGALGALAGKRYEAEVKQLDFEPVSNSYLRDEAALRVHVRNARPRARVI